MRDRKRVEAAAALAEHWWVLSLGNTKDNDNRKTAIAMQIYRECAEELLAALDLKQKDSEE